jgi:spore photoproduct lyase
VQRELEGVPAGVFSTGELADSLAVEPPLLPQALDFFAAQRSRVLLLVTKSTRIEPLLRRRPSPQVIVSFSINSPSAAARFERGAPAPSRRLEAARTLKEAGWRVRVRIDPVIIENGSAFAAACRSRSGGAGLADYETLCQQVAELQPECVTVGTLRQYPGLHRFSKEAPKDGLVRAPDGRMRYAEPVRVEAYTKIARWLGARPALCKETKTVWGKLGWRLGVCNCVVKGGVICGSTV